MWKKQKKVLLIEDDLDLLEMGEMFCRSYGFTDLLLAKNSKEAGDILEKEKIDICISDIKFPIKNGVELMREMKQKGRTPDILIFLSGFSDYSLKELEDVGAKAFFSKPTNFNEIFKTIENHLLKAA